MITRYNIDQKSLELMFKNRYTDRDECFKIGNSYKFVYNVILNQIVISDKVLQSRDYDDNIIIFELTNPLAFSNKQRYLTRLIKEINNIQYYHKKSPIKAIETKLTYFNSLRNLKKSVIKDYPIYLGDKLICDRYGFIPV